MEIDSALVDGMDSSHAHNHEHRERLGNFDGCAPLHVRECAALPALAELEGVSLGARLLAHLHYAFAMFSLWCSEVRFHCTRESRKCQASV